MSDKPIIKPLADGRWMLVEDFHGIPAGFTTDGASVPRFLWRVLGPPMEADTVGPSIEHDYDYETGRIPRFEADCKYYRNLRRDGVRAIRASLYWLGVRGFGWLHYNNNERNTMNKLILFAAVTAALCARAGLHSVDLEVGDNAVPAPCRAVLLHAIPTNASGTVTLKKVSSLSYAWTDWQTVTNITYGTAWSNLTHTVTNDIVTAWRTNAVDGAVATNFLAEAVDSVPSVYPWPDLLILTNKVARNVAYTNIPYRIESSRRVERVAIPRRADRHVTNDLATVTLSSGFKTNAVSCIFAPGDWISASGTAFGGGRVQLIIEK